MASGLRVLMALLMAANASMAAGLHAENVADESKPEATNDAAEKSIANTLAKYRWELVEAYDADGAVQTGWSNEWTRELGYERLQFWFDADALSTRVCNSLTWNYSEGPQGQITLLQRWRTMGACDGDGGKAMRLEACVIEQLNQLRRYELAEPVAQPPTLTLYFLDRSRWKLQVVELAGFTVGR